MFSFSDEKGELRGELGCLNIFKKGEDKIDISDYRIYGKNINDEDQNGPYWQWIDDDRSEFTWRNDGKNTRIYHGDWDENNLMAIIYNVNDLKAFENYLI